MIALQKSCYLGQLINIKQAGGVIASVTSYPDVTYAENMHYHENFVLSLVLKGGNIEKTKSKNIERFPGTVTCHDAGEPHQSTLMQSGSCHVNLEVPDQFMLAYGLQPQAAALENSSADARFLMFKIYKELFIDDQDSSLSIESSLLHLLQFAGKHHYGAGVPAWVLKTREVLYDRWDETLCLNELAIIAALHPANLSGYFPTYFGCTIGEYRRKIKIEKAFELLKSGNCSLTAVAHKCGFADQSHFTRTCKQLTGWSPKHLKKIIGL